MKKPTLIIITSLLLLSTANANTATTPTASVHAKDSVKKLDETHKKTGTSITGEKTKLNELLIVYSEELVTLKKIAYDSYKIPNIKAAE